MTCSKDAKVLVWHITGPDREVQLKATIDMKKEQVQSPIYLCILLFLHFVQNWVNTWGGRYNKTDSLLLVAGVINEVTLTPIAVTAGISLTKEEHYHYQLPFDTLVTRTLTPVKT